MVNATPRPLYARGRDPVHIVQEAEWTPGPSVWTRAENLPPTGIRYSDHPACSESLYRLSYPGLWKIYKEEKHEKDTLGGEKIHEYKEAYP